MKTVKGNRKLSRKQKTTKVFITQFNHKFKIDIG